jgi:hypothetical protein
MRHGIGSAELPYTPRLHAQHSHTRHTTIEGRMRALMCALSPSGGTVLRAGTRISRRTLTLERIQTKQSPQIPRPRNGRISLVCGALTSACRCDGIA